MSVTLPARVLVAPLWIRIVVALADWMSTLDWRLMDTMWVPPAVADPAVMVASLCKPTHSMAKPGLTIKLT